MENTGRTRILVIGDDQSIVDTLQAILEPQAFEVFEAQSGLEGINTTRQLNPEVIILDLLVGEIDGLEVCRTIRSFSKAPILVLSALSKPGVVARALDEGADDYLLKPTPSNVLIAHIRKLARRARVEKSNDISKPDYYVSSQ